MKRFPWVKLLLTLGTLMALAGTLQAAPPRYFYQNLGTLSEKWKYSDAVAVNASGQVV